MNCWIVGSTVTDVTTSLLSLSPLEKVSADDSKSPIKDEPNDHDHNNRSIGLFGVERSNTLYLEMTKPAAAGDHLEDERDDKRDGIS